MGAAASGASGVETMERLQGKHAVITGAGRGIGNAIARRFATEGARVTIADINPETARGGAQEIVAQGGLARAVQVDVSDSKSVGVLVETARRELGEIDILVNNAGILQLAPTPLDAILAVTEAEWDLMLAINLKGMFLVSQAVLPSMLARRRGVILNIASVAARTGGSRGWASYPASKAGVIGLTIDMAKKLAPRGIRVNAIAPGTIETELVQNYSPAERLAFAHSSPMGRSGTPDEIAQAALFLCSEESSYVTGQVLNVDGGATTF